MNDEVEELKAEEKASEASEEARGRADEKRRDGGSWMVGLILIALGGLFLLSNVFSISFVTNWWAIFILIPALFNLNRAWQSYRSHGRLTSGGRSALVSGLLILTMALIFLMNLDWGVVWPLFIIIVGVGILLQVASR